MNLVCEINPETLVCERCGVKSRAANIYRMCSVPRWPEMGGAVAFKEGGESQPQPSGPGTELSKLLKRFGIEPTPTCSCRAKAAEMDAWGPDECSKPERIEEVVAVMREEAKARGLPFLDAAGRMLVRRAIANARRASASLLHPSVG